MGGVVVEFPSHAIEDLPEGGAALGRTQSQRKANRIAARNGANTTKDAFVKPDDAGEPTPRM